MLVLSRQVDETVMIGDDIEVTVVDIRGDKVRLGITAPKDIAVHRKEVYEAIKRENRDAGRVVPGSERPGSFEIDLPRGPKAADAAHTAPTEVRDQAHRLRTEANAAGANFVAEIDDANEADADREGEREEASRIASPTRLPGEGRSAVGQSM